MTSLAFESLKYFNTYTSKTSVIIPKIIFTVLFILLIFYSSLNASIGLILVALNAGISPISVPRVTRRSWAIKTTAIDTEAFTSVTSSPCPHALFAAINIHPPEMMPNNPARRVKNTASTTIWRLISKGVAHKARLTPISLVRSLTVINNRQRTHQRNWCKTCLMSYPF